MVSYNSIEPFILTTDANTSKNFTSASFNYTSSSLSVPSGSYVLRQFEITLSTNTRFYQIYLYADIWNGYRTFPMTDVVYAAGTANQRSIAINLTQSGSVININFWFTNQSTSTQTYPSFNIIAERRDFVDEVI